MADNPYTAEFFATSLTDSYRSGRRIVPLVIDLIRPRAVLDAGCGTGHFLRAFQDAGIADLKGIDGAYVPREQLVVDPALFEPVDLGHGFDLHRRYDLVVSLEVAEHLAPDAAAGFVASLTRHAPAVLFSAAIPHQGGTGHLNEQWPTYWAALFADHGYRPYDLLRPALWNDSEVAWWYRQNLLLFVDDGAKANYPGLAGLAPSAPETLDRIHPDLYFLHIEQLGGANAHLNGLQNYLASGTLFEIEHTADGQHRINKKQ